MLLKCLNAVLDFFIWSSNKMIFLKNRRCDDSIGEIEKNIRDIKVRLCKKTRVVHEIESRGRGIERK
jgi:hypothetical protein